MRRPVIAANWKMYKTVREAEAFVEAFVAATVGDFFDARLGGARVDIGDRQLGAFAGETLHDGAADAASATGDDGYFIIEGSLENFSIVSRRSSRDN